MNPPSSPQTGSAAKRPLVWLTLGCAGIALIAGLGWLAAKATDAYEERAFLSARRRTVDASNLRQIGQSALIWATEHNGRLPPAELSPVGVPDGTTPATIHRVAAALARDGGLNYAMLWFSHFDEATSASNSRGSHLNTILDATGERQDTRFAAESAITWEFATGLDMSLPATTPVAWTRGLRTDGSWDPANRIYGNAGGYIVFLGGNVQFYSNLSAMPLTRPDGTPTTNILETLPSTARVVGAGPGTLHGAVGLAPAR